MDVASSPLFKVQTAWFPVKYLNNKYHMPGLNRNKITGTFGFNTVNGLKVVVKSQEIGAAARDFAIA